VGKQSAGVVLYRLRGESREVLLVHPGGPFYSRKDAGVWSIPKGEFLEGEDPLQAALRELKEETGWVPEGDPIRLEPIRQAGGKWVHAWAFLGDVDSDSLRSNTFLMEWPPRSGRRQEFPEVDRAGWFSLEEARSKILPSQVGLLDQLASV
jgi:predicted NUDIX family NTP pyrophosphohydrolase